MVGRTYVGDGAGVVDAAIDVETVRVEAGLLLAFDDEDYRSGFLIDDDKGLRHRLGLRRLREGQRCRGEQDQKDGESTANGARPARSGFRGPYPRRFYGKSF